MGRKNRIAYLQKKCKVRLQIKNTGILDNINQCLPPSVIKAENRLKLLIQIDNNQTMSIAFLGYIYINMIKISNDIYHAIYNFYAY